MVSFVSGVVAANFHCSNCRAYYSKERRELLALTGLNGVKEGMCALTEAEEMYEFADEEVSLAMVVGALLAVAPPPKVIFQPPPRHKVIVAQSSKYDYG